MPSRTLSESEFEAIRQRVLSAAPKGMDEAGFNRWFTPRFDGAIAEAEQLPEARGGAAGRFVGNAASALNPVAMAQGIYGAVRHPIDTAQAVIGQQADQFGKAKQAFSEGRYSEAAGHGVASALPMIGPAAANAGEQIGSGDVAGGLGAGVGLLAPVVAARPLVNAAGKAIGKTAVPLARSAIKPTVAQMRQGAGASQAGINARADRLAQFVVENGITTPQKAEAVIQAAEAELTSAIQRGNRIVDAPQRASRYLGALERSAARQGLPADDVAVIRSKAAELLNDFLNRKITGKVALIPSS